ncbi:MAG: polyphenol oxidase family protein [Chthoniobacterales bacterium]
MNLHPPFIQKIFLSPEKYFSATACLIGRIPGLILPSDRKEALLLQQPLHQKIVETLYLTDDFSTKLPLVCADQCHGSDIALVEPPFATETQEVAQVDGLMTSSPEVILGIRVADCAPVWIVDKNGRAGALIHSGKKGTEAGIVPKAILKMQETFHIDPQELIVTIGPCIRPPHYEIDFAKIIAEQALEAGVTMIQDEHICTASHLDRYYSYRREQGKTGHMLALLLLKKSKNFSEEESSP